MRIEKKIKKYADNKMEKFKDDEFLNSITNSHFPHTQKRKVNRKMIMSVATSFIVILVVTLSITLTIQSKVEYDTGQYETKVSTVEELNNHCEYYQFASCEDISIELIIDRSSQNKLFYNVDLQLKEESDCFTFICIINNEYDYMFDDYENYQLYGDYQINYRIISEYNEQNNIFTHKIDANLITNKEKIDIHYIGTSVDENNNFFELLSKILLAK